MHAQPLAHADSSVIPQTVACQSPLFMEFSRQEYWSGLLFPTPHIYTTLCKMGLPWWLRQEKNLPAMQETWVRPLGREDPLEKGMATHSCILAWEIPWMEEPDRLESMGLQRVRHD